MIFQLNFLLFIFIPFIFFEFILFRQIMKFLKLKIIYKQQFQEFINNISFNWSEAAGLDQTSEEGSEHFGDIIILFGILSAFFSFIPYLISYNCDFTLIFSFSITIILLSFFLYIPISWGKITLEVINRKSPFILIPILIFIEAISYMFKILSLTIRISVNSSTGHAFSLIFFTLSFFLINFSLKNFSKFIAFTFYLICIIYMLMKIFISLLQIYVFNLLSYYYEYENF